MSAKARHGHSTRTITTPTYKSWQNMRRRCVGGGVAENRYLDRGIVICDRWNDFANFLADMGERPHKKELDRINNDGNYEPSNCRWATRDEQMRNTSRTITLTHNGKTQCLKDWAVELRIAPHLLLWRFRKNWPMDKLLNSTRHSNGGNKAGKLR
jgi:hypothetical protein